MKTFTAWAALALATTALSPALADTLSDKRTGGDYYDFYLSDSFTKVNACGCAPIYDAALVDSFTLSRRSALTGLSAALVGFDQPYDEQGDPLAPTWVGFGSAQAYLVNIFSSADKAAQSLIGDVYSASIAPGAVTFGPGFTVTGPYGGEVVGSTLATIAFSKVLDAGTYWLSVAALNDPDDNGTIGVAVDGATDGAAFMANPNGGFGFGATLPTGANAGYAVFGAAVPEPATWGLMVLGFGLAGGAMRRRRATVAA